MCQFGLVLECVVNVSEGRDPDTLAELTRAAGPALLDRHSDAAHHRTVFTLAGPLTALRQAVNDLVTVAVARLDLTDHVGVHPRIGVVDVVPWVPFEHWPLEPLPAVQAVTERDRFARWAANSLGLPCFLYGPDIPGMPENKDGRGRTLPTVRRRAWRDLLPDTGPQQPHPTAGASAVGARSELVAYNLWLEEADLPRAQSIAASLRSPTVRALGLPVDRAVQVSCNLIAPSTTSIEVVYDAVADQAAIAKAELVGLLRAELLVKLPVHRWAELGVEESSTIEARLEEAGFRPDA
jgi:glutamate formiminotransferase / 5-formyltetrahydrofolate cyclo-ligase